MKKIIHIIGLLYLLTGMVACIGDDGNYTYISAEDINPIKVSGIEATYQLESMKICEITPVIEGLNEKDEYTYSWYIYSTAQIFGAKRDTISRTPKLSYDVNLKTGDYTLIFSIKNQRNKVEKIIESTLSVSSGVGRGWYILKDDGTDTDLDILTFDGVIKSNVYSKVNGSKLPGKGRKIASFGQNFGYEVTLPDGTLTGKIGKTPIVVFLSQKDMAICEADKLEMVVPFKQAFAIMPEKAPQDFLQGSACLFLVNNGKIHNTYLMGMPPHKFGYHTTGNYHIHGNDIFVGRDACLMFDDVSKSLITDKGAFNESPVIGFPVHDPLVNPYNCRNMQCEVVYMSGQEKEGVGIFNKSGEYYVAELDNKFESDKNPIVSWEKVETGKEILKSTLFTLNKNPGSKYIYFVNESGQIMSYSMNNGTERKQIGTIPPGEKVAYMNHLVYKGWQDEEFHINAFVVLTNTNSGWKLYTYPFVGETGDILDEPLLRGQGEGMGRYIFYRSKWSL